MSFLGKIGQSLGIGELTHKPLKALESIIPTAAGAFLGGPAGAGIGNAIGQKIQGKSILGSALGGLETYGLASGIGALYDNAGNIINSGENAVSSGVDSAKSALGFPSSTAVTPTATAAGSASQIIADPSLIENAAAGTAGAGGEGLTNVGLTSQLAGGAGATALPASTAAAAPTGLLAKASSALGSPLGRAATTLAPVALRALQGNPVSAEQKALEAQAQQLGAQGSELASSLNTGKLPAGVQAGLDQQKQDALTAIKSQYANRGLSGSTMEAQALQAVENQSESAKAEQLQKLFTEGTNEIGSSSALYNQIMQANVQQDKGLSDAIAAAIGSLGDQQPQQQPLAA